jgi:beta-lactamase regulating signal transducer with metallopeptidase domain
MLPIIVEAALRSTVLTLVVLLALKALRLSNPHIQMTAWRTVLAASLLMPFFAGWAKLPLAPAGLTIPQVFSSDAAIFFGPPSGTASAAEESRPLDWHAILASIYLLVAGALLLRLLVGSALTWRLCRSAVRVREEWTRGCDVRASAFVTMPLTFASTILVPASYTSWDATTRRAVIAHESSHVGQGDFYVLLLASINRAVFWFSPLAWWLHGWIAYLAEARSDAAALQDIDDRARYAEILLDFGAAGGPAVASLAMARPRTVRQRIERILAESGLPRRMDWRGWSVVVSSILLLAAVTAGAVAQVPAESQQSTASTLDAATLARRREEQKRPRQQVQIDPGILGNYVGYYQLGQFTVLTISRQGDDLYAQVTGQRSLQILAESTAKFFYKAVPAQISFFIDAQGRATEIVHHQNGLESRARRIDQAQAQGIEASLANRIKEGTPVPGSSAALKRQIDAFQQGQPAYGEMTDELAVLTRPQIFSINSHFAQLGPLQSISFRGVGAQGWDVYEAKFANGISICRIFLAADGKISGLLFQWGP